MRDPGSRDAAQASDSAAHTQHNHAVSGTSNTTTNANNTTNNANTTTTATSAAAGAEKSVPPQPRSAAPNRKSKTWSNRLSSLLPSLMLPSTDSVPVVPKQPTTAPPPPPVAAAAAAQTPISTPTSAPVDTPALTKSSTPTDNSPTSSTPSIVETPTIRMTGDDDYSLGFVQPTKQSPQGSPPTLPTLPAQDSDTLDISRSGNNPQIMAPIPPSPEMSRVAPSIPSAPTIAPPAVPPPAVPAAGEQSPVEQNADSLKVGKLRKEKPDTRRRSSSLQHLASEIPPMLGLKSRTDSPAPELRGRRASSVQPASARGSPSSSRVPSASINVRPGSSKGAESPTRGRLRRSWMPGGRSRSNSVDVSAQSAASAWVLSDDTRAEYNASFLKNAEKVRFSLRELVAKLTCHLRSQSSGTRAATSTFSCTPVLADAGRPSKFPSSPSAHRTSSTSSFRPNLIPLPVGAEDAVLEAETVSVSKMQLVSCPRPVPRLLLTLLANFDYTCLRHHHQDRPRWQHPARALNKSWTGLSPFETCLLF